MPYISKVATGKLKCLNVFGDDYNTKDGTGVRDYIHVVDLAKGHVAALKCYKNNFKQSGVINGIKNNYVYNLGTGKGTTVFELINTYEKVNGIKVNYKIASRRDGDVDKLYCSPKKACIYPGMDEELNGAEVNYEEVNVDGKFITSRGLGTAIPFALAIIGEVQGQEAAEKMAKTIVFRQ